MGRCTGVTNKVTIDCRLCWNISRHVYNIQQIFWWGRWSVPCLAALCLVVLLVSVLRVWSGFLCSKITGLFWRQCTLCWISPVCEIAAGKSIMILVYTRPHYTAKGLALICFHQFTHCRLKCFSMPIRYKWIYSYRHFVVKGSFAGSIWNSVNSVSQAQVSIILNGIVFIIIHLYIN